VPRPALAELLGLPSAELVSRLVAPPLREVRGRVTAVPEADEKQGDLPDALQRAVGAVAADLQEAPFSAPTADRLQELGLDARALTAATRAGRLLHLGNGIVLLPDADRQAVEQLRELPQPFTTSEARSRLGTTRRVVLPLLQHLDRQGRTRRHPDDRRSVVGPAPEGQGALRR
jgi:selenocysteine-specific elongation factor